MAHKLLGKVIHPMHSAPHRSYSLTTSHERTLPTSLVGHAFIKRIVFIDTLSPIF